MSPWYAPPFQELSLVGPGCRRATRMSPRVVRAVSVEVSAARWSPPLHAVSTTAAASADSAKAARRGRGIGVSRMRATRAGGRRDEPGEPPVSTYTNVLVARVFPRPCGGATRASGRACSGRERRRAHRGAADAHGAGLHAAAARRVVHAERAVDATALEHDDALGVHVAGDDRGALDLDAL